MSNLPAVKCKDWLLNGYKIQMLCEIQGAAECSLKNFKFIQLLCSNECILCYKLEIHLKNHSNLLLCPFTLST